MRHPVTVLLGMISVLLLQPAGAQAQVGPGPALEAASPVIAAGRLTDPAGQPVSGSVELLAWPDHLALEVGDTVTLLPVAQGVASRDGSFRLQADNWRPWPPPTVATSTSPSG